MQRMSRRPRGWSGPGSAEIVEWLDGAEPPVRVVVVQLRALRPQVPKPPRCSPGAANRTDSRSNSSNLYISAAHTAPSKRASACSGKWRSAAVIRPLADTLLLCSTLLAMAALSAAFKNVALAFDSICSSPSPNCRKPSASMLLKVWQLPPSSKNMGSKPLG